MRVGSLFSGIGGFELGFQRSGQPYEIAWQVEIDEWSRRLLAARFPDAERFADVREVGAHNLAPIDVLVGGFPCQDISTAGAGAGLAGARSGLWFEMLRIVREMRPKYVVAENVRALVSRGLPVVVEGLVGAGYRVDWCILSAADVGAPHKRDRVWIVASRRDMPQRFAPQLTLADAQRFRSDVWPRGGDPELWERGVPRAHPTAIKVADRPKRLKGLGNAIVPQIAELIAQQLVEPASIFDRVSLDGAPATWSTPVAHMAKQGGYAAEYERNTPLLTASVIAAESARGAWPTLPTPTATSYGTNCGIGQAPRPGLEAMARNAAWPTPRAEHDSGRHKGKPDTLHSAVKAWPTPAASDNRDRGCATTPAIGRRIEAGKQVMLSMMHETGRLNPQWVELLMGYPVDWTRLAE